MLGVKLGRVLGVKLGRVLGVKLGSVLGVKLGRVLGVKLGSVISSKTPLFWGVSKILEGSVDITPPPRLGPLRLSHMISQN